MGGHKDPLGKLQWRYRKCHNGWKHFVHPGAESYLGNQCCLCPFSSANKCYNIEHETNSSSYKPLSEKNKQANEENLILEKTLITGKIKVKKEKGDGESRRKQQYPPDDQDISTSKVKHFWNSMIGDFYAVPQVLVAVSLAIYQFKFFCFIICAYLSH